ncbi:MAG: hypothetical protein AB7K09_06320 [Planctomycetota bacterium]
MADLNASGMRVVRQEIADLTGECHEENRCRVPEIETMVRRLGEYPRLNYEFTTAFVVRDRGIDRVVSPGPNNFADRRRRPHDLEVGMEAVGADRGRPGHCSPDPGRLGAI